LAAVACVFADENALKYADVNTTLDSCSVLRWFMPFVSYSVDCCWFRLD